LSDRRRLSRPRSRSPRRVFDYVQGSFLVIAKFNFERCGGFDECFFFYGEDVDLCLRVRAAGLSIGYDPDTSIIHHGGGSGKNFAPRLDCFISACNLLYRKYRQGPQVKLLEKSTKAALRLRLIARHVFIIMNFVTSKRKIASLFAVAEAAEKEDSV
jgi:GT2 family glycosyltransferase